MADILFLYASPHVELARTTVAKLHDELITMTIWWDEGRSRESWDTEFKEALQNARCAVVLWNKEAAEMGRQSIMNEIVEVESGRVPILALHTDSAPARGAIENAKSLDYSGPSSIGNVVNSIFDTLGDGRDWIDVLDSGEIQLPCFVRSVSSHETLISPKSALEALVRHPSTEPVLISSYDIFCSNQDKDEIKSLIQKLQSKGVAIFLDSGNYESYRKGESTDDSSRHHRLNAEQKIVWDHEKHLEISSSIEADVGFQFDPTDGLRGNNLHGIVSKATAYFENEERESKCQRLVPIIHIPRSDDGSAQIEKLTDVASRIIKKLQPFMIAVPERELGEGLCQRVKTVQGLRKTLDEMGKYRKIHLLGTGNPVSIAVLAKAGADSFDGLEWCRTVADHETGHLFHAQHFDFFADQRAFSPNENVRNIISDPDADWRSKLLLHNLDFFDDWIGRLRFNLKRGTIRPLLEKSLRAEQLESLDRQLPEISK